jgi:hypothetical protein
LNIFYHTLFTVFIIILYFVLTFKFYILQVALVQRRVRGWKARKRVNEIKRKGKIASQIQKIYRGRSTRIAFRYYKRDLKAAITIQKYIRQASLLRNKAVSIKITKRRNGMHRVYGKAL